MLKKQKYDLHSRFCIILGRIKEKKDQTLVFH